MGKSPLEHPGGEKVEVVVGEDLNVCWFGVCLHGETQVCARLCAFVRGKTRRNRGQLLVVHGPANR